MIDHVTAEAAVRRVLKEWDRGDDIDLNTKLTTFDFDSLDAVEVVFDLESEFDFLTTQKQFDKLKTVNDLVELVKQNGTTTD